MSRWIALLASTLPMWAGAAEGMWPLNMLPTTALSQARLQPNTAQLQGAAVNVGGASGGFVSANGLVLTNHHVVSDCIDKLSTAARPLQQTGFVAASPQDELRCPGLSVRVLVGIDEQLRLPNQAAARKAAIHHLERKGCPASQVCQVVALYGGAVHQRYRYRNWSDVRLAMAPEGQAANFGGDDDNFGYPRFAFDFALLRVYDANGRPHHPAHWLRPTSSPLRLGDGVMVVGHPYQTERMLTVAQLEAQRDVLLPLRVQALEAELVGLRRFAAQSPEAARQVVDLINGAENSLKANRGELAALRDAAIFQLKRDEETRIRSQAGTSAPWDAVAQATQAQRTMAPTLAAMRMPYGSLLGDVLDGLAVHDESRRPAGQRLEAFSGVGASTIRETVSADRPVYLPLERARLAHFIERAQNLLGSEHAWVQTLLGGEATPQAAAQRWMTDTALVRARARRALLAEGTKAAPDVPLLTLAQQLLPLYRAALQRSETEVHQALLTQADALAKARWQALGRSAAPDATGTLRLSWGRTAEVSLGGLRQPWASTFGGLWDRADAFAATPPFNLAPSVAAARNSIDPRVPLNFIATTDIVGGNSGSPVVNAQGEWVGVAFDGNLDSLAGNYVYDERSNRMVSVHIQAIGQALNTIYPASHLARELGLRQSPP